MDLVRNIEIHARTNPEKMAIVSKNIVVTYRRLLKVLNGITERVARTNLQQGDMVAVMTDNNYIALTMILALSRRGVISLPISPGYDPSTLGLSIKALITDKSTVKQNFEEVIQVDRSWMSGGKQQIDISLTPGFVSDKDICVVAMSSGTTGVPKIIGQTLRHVRSRAWNFPGNSGPMSTSQIRDMITVGLATGRGLVYMLRTLWSGGILFLPHKNIDAQTYLRTINLYCIEQMMTAPLTLQRFIDHQKRIKGTCPTLKTVIVGGSPMSSLLAKEAREYLCSNIIFAFGCSEAGIVAYAPVRLLEKIPGAAGFIVPWANVETVDESGSVLGVGEEGILRIYVPEEHGVRSYLSCAEENVNSFRDNWFYPGDTGYVTKERMLVITGRTSEIINLGGNKISPTQLEEILINHEKIQDVVVIGIKNEYGIEEICAAVVGNGEVTAEEILEFSKKHRKTSNLTKIIFVDSIPHNEMGKILRQKLRASIAQQQNP